MKLCGESQIAFVARLVLGILCAILGGCAGSDRYSLADSVKHRQEALSKHEADPVCGVWRVEAASEYWTLAIAPAHDDEWDYHGVMLGGSPLVSSGFKLGEVMVKINEIETGLYEGVQLWKNALGMSFGYKRAELALTSPLEFTQLNHFAGPSVVGKQWTGRLVEPISFPEASKGASPPAFGEEPAAPDSISTGTAFAVSSEGHVVTAYHIVQGKQSIKVYLSSESPSSAKLLHGDPVNDLAVLKMEQTTPHFLRIAPIRSAKSGDRVFTVGFPVTSLLGEEAKYTEGVISSLTGIEGASSLLQITVPVQPGNSGGPLVNESGEVVGIITSTAAILPFVKESGTLPQNVNWAVKADYLRPMIELPNVERAHGGRDELIAHVKKSTFLIQANYHAPPKEELVPEHPTQSREPRVIAAPEPSAYSQNRPRIVVKGIAYSETNPSALIGEEIVHEGDTISGVHVVKIRKDSVEFSFNGTTWRQAVNR